MNGTSTCVRRVRDKGHASRNCAIASNSRVIYSTSFDKHCLLCIVARPGSPRNLTIMRKTLPTVRPFLTSPQDVSCVVYIVRASCITTHRPSADIYDVSYRLRCSISFLLKKPRKPPPLQDPRNRESQKGTHRARRTSRMCTRVSDLVSRSGGAIGSLRWVKRNRPITSPLLDSKLLHMGSPSRPAIKILYQGLWRPASRTRTPVSRGLVLPQRTRRPDAHRGWQGGRL